MTTEAAAPAAPRRSDAGQVRLTDRDITGLLLLAEHYAAPYDLLSAAMSAPRRGPARSWPVGGPPALRPAAVRARPRVVLAHPTGMPRPAAATTPARRRWRASPTSARSWPLACGSRNRPSTPRRSRGGIPGVARR